MLSNAVTFKNPRLFLECNSLLVWTVLVITVSWRWQPSTQAKGPTITHKQAVRLMALCSSGMTDEICTGLFCSTQVTGQVNRELVYILI